MKQTSWIVLRYLIEHASPEAQPDLSHYISEQARVALGAVYSTDQSPWRAIPSLGNQLRFIHYSWFIPFLHPFGPSDKECFISALDRRTQQKLSSYFQLASSLPALSPIAARFFHARLFSWVTASCDELTPRTLLPSHPLNLLLDLTKTELQQVANLLGLRDLASEIKYIIRKHQVTTIQAALTQREKEVLKTLLVHPPRPIFPSLHLDKWDGDETSLKNILHHRGLNRLSKALFGCHPALLWHLSHQLDTGRAKIIHRFCTDVKQDSLKEMLINQALAAVSTLRNHHE